VRVKRRHLEPVYRQPRLPEAPETGGSPRLAWIATGVYVFSLLMIAGGILMAPEDQPTRWFDEKQTMTSYSATLLYTCLLLSFVNFLAARSFSYPRSSARPLKRFWALGMAGFFVLMIDEFFVMHEGVGGAIAYRLLGLAKSPLADRFDGFIVAFYGLAAIVILAIYRHDLKKIPGFIAFLLVGAVFGATSVIMDLGGGSLWGVYLEEGTKILANASFVLACLAATLKNYAELRVDLNRGKKLLETYLKSTNAEEPRPAPGPKVARARSSHR
jgi:hypothetical protein